MSSSKRIMLWICLAQFGSCLFGIWTITCFVAYWHLIIRDTPVAWILIQIMTMIFMTNCCKHSGYHLVSRTMGQKFFFLFVPFSPFCYHTAFDLWTLGLWFFRRSWVGSQLWEHHVYRKGLLWWCLYCFTAWNASAILEASLRFVHIISLWNWWCRCSHYRRRCRIRAPCCDEVFDCRHCHNDVKVCFECNIFRFICSIGYPQCKIAILFIVLEEP